MILGTVARAGEPISQQVNGFRWAFVIKALTTRALIIGIDSQYQIKTTGEWHTGGDYYSLVLGGRWRWGRTHGYYDGPHDMFGLGWIKFCWSGQWCEECMPSGACGDGSCSTEQE